MFCSKCGYKNQEGTRFCINCGTPLQTAGNAQPQAQNQYAPPPGQYPPPGQMAGYPPVVQKKRSTGLIVGLCVTGAVVVAAAIVLVLLLTGEAQSQDNGIMTIPKNYCNLTTTGRLIFTHLMGILKVRIRIMQAPVKAPSWAKVNRMTLLLLMM